MTTQLEGDHTQLLQFLYACPVGLLEIAPEGEIAMINPLAMQLLLSIARTPMIINFFELTEAYAPELRNMVDAFAGDHGSVCEGHRIVVRPDTAEAAYEAKVFSCTLVKLSRKRLIVTLTDVSRQVDQERRLKQAETWFASLMDGVNDFAVVSLDARGRIEHTNSSLFRQTGFSEAEVMGKTLDIFEASTPASGTLSAEEQIAIACRDGWYLTEGDQSRANGEHYWAQRLIAVRHLAERGQERTASGFTVVLRDVTRQDSDTGKLAKILRTDHLTSAYNRAHFFELAEREFRRAKRYQQKLSITCIDIDHFKRVNDTHGHAAGDEVLRIFSKACMGLLRPSDIFARLGGEEFVALLPATDLPGAMHFSERVRGVLAGTGFRVKGEPITISASYGCAELSESTNTLSELLATADGALYRAKHLGRDRVVGSERPGLAKDAE
ncbi:MAG: diguanylate cyclase [Janthinobacterium lividum]